MNKLIATALCMWLVGCSARPVQTLNFHATPANNLEFLYGNLNVEFAGCLYGKIQGTEVYADRLELAYIVEATSTYTQHYECRSQKHLLGFLHSHPENDCRINPEDVRFFLNTTSHRFDFLLCGRNRIVWMDRPEAARYLADLAAIERVVP